MYLRSERSCQHRAGSVRWSRGDKTVQTHSLFLKNVFSSTCLVISCTHAPSRTVNVSLVARLSMNCLASDQCSEWRSGDVKETWVTSAWRLAHRSYAICAASVDSEGYRRFPIPGHFGSSK
jgi:hypothetical protein